MIRISGLQKLSLLDYPGHIASIIFTQGCNYKCTFCQNSLLIKNTEGLIDTEEVFDYLEKRKKVLDGVVISGGEPCIQKNLVPFIERIKQYNLKIKLDTNGTNPEMLSELIDRGLIDYIAMDIKTTFQDYKNIVGTNDFIENVKNELAFLDMASISFKIVQ